MVCQSDPAVLLPLSRRGLGGRWERGPGGEDSRARRPLLALLCLLLALAPSLAAQTLDDAFALHDAGKLREAVAAYRAVAATAGPEDAALARSNACVALTELGDYRAALDECREALRLEEGLDDPPSLARTLNNAGLVLQYLGRFDDAERHFGKALEINRRSGDAESQVINLANLGLVATSAGRYDQALRWHGEAASLAGRHPDEPWAAEQVRVARINQGVVLERLGAFREALGLYRQVLAEGDALDPRRRAALEVNTGVVYRNLGDPVSALEAFREAVSDFELEDTAALSNAWLNIGLVHHLNLDRPRAAEEAYRKALAYAEASGDRTEEIQDLFYLGRLLLDRGRLDEAGQVFQRCLAVSERSGSAEGRWSALDGLGRVAAARGEPERALEHFGRAMDEIEHARSALPRPSLRFRFFGDKRPVYAAAVEVLAGLERARPGEGHAERALEIAQRAKSRALLDTLSRTRRRPTPLTAAGLRQRIGGDVLLEYFLGERHLYLWTVRDSGVRMADLGPSAPLLARVLETHRLLSRGGAPPASTLNALSRALLGPAGPLPRSPGQTRIAPDGGLRYLPFELLADRVTISYLPSGSALAWLEPAEKRPAVALVGFGNPEAGAAARFRLPPLPATVRELASIARRFPGEEDLYLGPRATEAAFREAVTRGARVVHLATHTVIDERPGRSTAILLTPRGDDDGLLSPDEISALPYGADLTVLAACSTALSPESGEGGALASLTGSFLAAGSPAVVATLWDVGDTASAAFMEQLYHQLGRGHAPAEALRRAKETLRADPRWDRPALWAGYVLIGEGPPLAPRRPRLTWIIPAVLLGGLAAFWGWKRWRAPRAR